MRQKDGRRLHRSFLLDASLVAEAKRLAPRELSDNLNRMIGMALKTYVAKLKQDALEREMARMAADPALRRVSKAIADDFRAAEGDGL